MAAAPRTLFEKVWDDHVIGDDLLYVDLHLVHEVTSPQAFEGLRAAGRTVRRPDRTIATADHNVATGPGEPDQLSARPSSRRSIETAPSSACACTRSATAATASCT